MGSLAVMLPFVKIKLSNFPFLFIIKYSINPKNLPIFDLLTFAMSLSTFITANLRVLQMLICVKLIHVILAICSI